MHAAAAAAAVAAVVVTAPAAAARVLAAAGHDVEVGWQGAVAFAVATAVIHFQLHCLPQL